MWKGRRETSVQLAKATPKCGKHVWRQCSKVWEESVETVFQSVKKCVDHIYRDPQLFVEKLQAHRSYKQWKTMKKPNAVKKTCDNTTN